ncbi:uncharacterized protein LOC117483411 [Trematomus bernacchii]|uniref:uncharacterized protein LOC117483411 n=1 Tax=Trematomus bernacchii TaxID=40690 RepID=UPI00146AF32A|nr:uncharacterized protein LOC117483411 [Trematomus bernacchii]
MNVRHTLICFLLLTLRDGNSGLTNAQNLDRTEPEGGNITVRCSFSFSGGRKIFCKGKCEEGNILVETTGDSAQRGRYSIDYKEGTYPVSETVLYVSITKLTKSDAGRYQCGLEDRPFIFFDSYQDIEIRVTDAPTSSKPEVTPRPFPTSSPSASTLTTTQRLSSVPSSASPERTTQPQQGQTVLAGHGVVLYVRLTLVVMFLVLSASVLIFCWKRARKDPPVEPEYGVDTEANQVYEDVREEDGGSGSPPVLISTIYSYAQYIKPNGVETTDEYSFVTEATSQEKTKDDPSNLNYSELDSSNSGAPCGDADNVLSAPRALQDGNSGLIKALSLDRTGSEGADITVACSFSFSGGRKIFCKGKCYEENILVETTGDSAQRGRYSIRYVEGSLLSDYILYVSITKLTKSDAGRYQCGLDRSFLPDSYQDIKIRVTDAPTSLTSSPSASTLTTTQSLSSVPSSASPERTTQPQQGQTAPAGHGTFSLLFVFMDQEVSE